MDTIENYKELRSLAFKNDDWDMLLIKTLPIDWWQISKDEQLPLSFIKRNFKFIDFDAVLTFNKKLSYSFILDFYHKINWKSLSCNSNLSSELLYYFRENLRWDRVIQNRILTHQEYIKFKPYIEDKYQYLLDRFQPHLFNQEKQYDL